MKSPARTERISGAEVFLPLLFFSDQKIFIAVVLIFMGAGLTLSFFEMLRFQSRYALSAFYLFWLAACGGLVWIFLKIPPYWVWSVHLFIPKNTWAPSETQRCRPFLYGYRKYGGRRFRELAGALLHGSILAIAIFLMRQYFQSVASWILAVTILVFSEVVLAQVRRSKK